MSGYKTYATAIAIGLLAAAYGMGWIDKNTYETLLGILMGGGLAFLRAGVAKSGPQ